MAKDICGKEYHFMGDDGKPHSTHCVLDPDIRHTGNIDAKHLSACGFSWVDSKLKAIRRTG